MSRIRLAAPSAVALALALVASQAVAQQPAPPAAQPAPAEPAPAAPAPSQATPGEQMPPASPQTGTMGTPSPLQPGDAFGQEVSLPERTIIYLKGHTNWDTAFDTLVDSFKSLNDYLDKQGIKADGLPMTIYTQTDDTGFQFEAAMPVAEAPKDPPKGDIAVGKAPTGKALKFVHRGSYDAMDSTYEAITNYLDDKQLEAKDLFIEEYTTSPVTSNPDKLVINVFVPVK
ncbi:MAG TPA: GyrI-like domain-containing protein [Pseudolabrys sp.]|jgi:effector-binding domain-containing protein